MKDMHRLSVCKREGLRLKSRVILLLSNNTYHCIYIMCLLGMSFIPKCTIYQNISYDTNWVYTTSAIDPKEYFHVFVYVYCLLGI